MMIVPAGVKVHLALGYTDMRKGLDGLAMLVQQTLSRHRGAHLTNLQAYDRQAERYQPRMQPGRQRPRLMPARRSVAANGASDARGVSRSCADAASGTRRLTEVVIEVRYTGPGKERIVYFADMTSSFTTRSRS